jgi:O-antigen ligase
MIGVLAAVGIWAAHTGLICLLNGVQIYMGIRGGQLGERNSFAGAIVALLPIQIYCIHIYNWKFKKFSKIFLSVILFLFLSAVVLSDSRGAIVGLAVSIMIYVIVLSKTKARDFIIFSILVCISIFFLPKSLFERMSTIEISMEQTEKSAADRMRNMIGAWEGTKDNPIYGMGPGCWILEANNYTGRHLEPHCIWLKVSVEYGFPGLLLYILIFIVTLFRLNKYRMIARDNLGNNDIYLMATILAISLSASMVTQSFGNAVFSEFMWSLLAISNSLCNIIKEENNFLYLPNGSTDD